MNSLARYENNGIELLINTETGESFASISGYARMTGKDKSTISRRLQTVASLPLKEAEIMTVSGIKTVALIPEDLIVEWLPKDSPEMASQLMKLGVRVYLHKLAGFEVTTTAVNQSKPLPTAVEYANALIGLESLQDSLLKQLIKDSMIDELELQRNCKMLSDGKSKISYTTVKVRSKQLGFSERDIKSGAELGKYVKKRIKPVLQEMIGRYPTYHYEINDELDQTIINFFRHQNIFPSK